MIADLPGEKLLLRGNHDYWWNAIGKIRSWLPASMHALQNDSIVWGDVSVSAARVAGCSRPHRIRWIQRT